jgi:TonB family protein
VRLSVLLLALSPLFAQDPTDSRGWVDQGVQAFRSGNYPEAVQAFERAVALEPGFPAAHLYLGTSYMQQYIPGAQSLENLQFADSAEREFQRVLDLEPQNKLAMQSLASLALNQKKWDAAKQWFNRVIAVDSNDADANYSLGFIAWSQWYPAYGQARASLRMKQEDPGPLPDGSVKQDLKARFTTIIEDGLRSLNRALEINPNYADAMAYINLLIRERADLDDTKAEYERDKAVADEWVDKALATKKRLAGGNAAPQPAPQLASSTPPTRIVINGNVAQANKVREVAPVYPPLAREAQITGIVRLNIVIGKDGTVIDIKLISGHPLLIPAAFEAVKQWEYRPTLLNGQPVEVATEISVNFTLN